MVRAKASASKSSNASSANVGFEDKLWSAADKLRNNMDAAEYKHVVLGLIFLKYVSDSVEEMRGKLVAGQGEYKDADEYRAKDVFWVPKTTRWSHLQANAEQPTIEKLFDDAGRHEPRRLWHRGRIRPRALLHLPPPEFYYA